MALRHYIEFQSLKAEPYRVEIFDENFVGTATEINGRPDGFSLDWQGDTSDPFAPVMPSGASFSMLIENSGQEGIISNLAGAREGRFKMVVKRGSGLPLYWAGWVVSDQTRQPDQHYPYLFEIFAVDGIARLEDKDYVDATTAEPYTGSATIIGHLINIISHIGLESVATWPTVRLVTNINWFDDAMSTSADPAGQAKVLHEAFQLLDSEGESRQWTVMEVLEAMCTAFGARFFHANGAYYFLQVGEYENATQKLYKYTAAGTLSTTTAAADLDITVDYTTEAGLKKLAGGQYTYLQPLKKIHVDYHHQSRDNRAYGVNFNSVNGPLVPVVLPGTINVDDDDTTQIRLIVDFVVKTTNLDPANVGYDSYPPHRYKMAVKVALDGAIHLQRDITVVNLYDLQEDELLWVNAFEAVEVFSPVISSLNAGQDVSFQLKLTSPYLETAYNDLPLSIEIELIEITASAIPSTLVETVTAFPPTFSWKTTGISLKVLEEGFGDNPALDIERATATDTEDDNSGIQTVDTYIGDGPLPFSRSRIFTGTNTMTTAWQLGGTGTAYTIGQLLSREMLALRKLPRRVFQVTPKHKSFQPYSRLVDGSNAFMPMRISLNAFSDFWEGEFVLIGRVYTDVTVSDPTTPGVGPGVGGNGSPSTPQLPPLGPIGVPVKEPFGGYPTSNFISPTSTSGEVVASVFNTAHTIAITAVPFSFVKKGDKINLVNPVTGYKEEFTVATTPAPSATTLSLSGTMVKDFPPLSFVQLNVSDVYRRTQKTTHYERNFSGEFWEIPTSVITLPNPTLTDASVIRGRVKVVRGGVVMLYDANNFPDCFGIKPSTNEIQFYQKCRDETVFVEVG